METRATAYSDHQQRRDPSPSTAWSQWKQQNSSQLLGSQYSRSSKMTDDWASRGVLSRQQMLHVSEEQMKRQRWSTYTADTSSTALESGNEENLFTGRKQSSDDESATLLDISQMSSTSDTSVEDSAEDILNTALSSMLSAANSLLISTMTARSDLARLQMMESALDKQLDQREEAILTEISNNEKMVQWMERASEKLDKLLLETSSGSKMEAQYTSAAPWARASSSETASKHWRAPSTTGRVNSLDTTSSLGIFEAKYESSSTLDRSAAKRLEKVLKRASSVSGSNTTTPAQQSRGSTVMDLPTSSRLMEKTSVNDLATRLGMPSSSTLARQSSTSAFSPSALSDTSEFRQRTPSITSESGPSSVVSSREDPNTSLTQTLLLTPQTPYDELPQPDHDGKSENMIGKRSMSSLRSTPNPILPPKHSSGGNAHVSEAALGQMSWDDNGDNTSLNQPTSSQLLGGKGALEALRKLNGGSSFGQNSQQNASPSPRWGGTFASWVGMSSPGA